MERPTKTMLRIGAWCVNPASGQISRDGQTVRLEERAMRLLLYLAENAGDVISIDDLLNQVWAGVTVTPDSVYQAVTSLRRQLGDDPKQPTYIATVPRLGYRMVAPVSPWPEQSGGESPGPPPAGAPAPGRRRKTTVMWAAGAVLFFALVAALLVRGRVANSNEALSHPDAPQQQKSIAVLPFLDLTDKMSHEIFADGMTEELADKFSKIPGLRVAAPRSSFLLKGKKMPIPEVARTLGVAYVLDGSIRESGARMRVAARLIRADSGYVVWSETYDRPWDDALKVQEDIASQVAKALRASIEAAPDHKPQ